MAASNGDKSVQGIIVEICGEEYRVAGEADVGQIQRVAGYVDARMKRLAEQSGRLPRSSLAVLAAMEIAAELLQSQDEKEALLRKACDSIERLNELVEQRSSLAPLTHSWLERRLGKPAEP